MKKYEEIQRNTEKYKEIQRNTKKYKEIQKIQDLITNAT